MPISVRMKVTIPEELFNMYTFKYALRTNMRYQTGPRMKRLFDGTVEGWHNKPDFRQEMSETFAMMAVKVFAAGKNEDQYRLVNNGADKHIIRPRNPRGFLIFKREYISSTKPWSLSSRPFVRYGDTWAVRKVSHPGFDPRYFDVQIADGTADDFYDDVQDAVKIGVQRTQSTST